MCGPAVNTAAKHVGRAAADAASFGTYEGFRKLKTPLAQLPEKGASTAAALLGAPPAPPETPAPEASADSGDAGPEPTLTSASPTESAAMLLRKRLKAMRLGLLSTIATSGQGASGSPDLFRPAAYAVGATGSKTALGQ